MTRLQEILFIKALALKSKKTEEFIIKEFKNERLHQLDSNLFFLFE